MSYAFAPSFESTESTEVDCNDLSIPMESVNTFDAIVKVNPFQSQGSPKITIGTLVQDISIRKESTSDLDDSLYVPK